MRWPDRRPALIVDLTTGREQMMRGQKAQVMRLLKANGASGLTHREADRQAGVTRLASLISDLELKDGIDIRDEWRRNSDEARYKAYILPSHYAIREVE